MRRNSSRDGFEVDSKGRRLIVEHLDSLPEKERKRFLAIAEKAAAMLNLHGNTISFLSPLKISAKIEGKTFIEPSKIVLNLSDEGLLGLFLHELGHTRYKILNQATIERITHFHDSKFGQWCVRLLEDVFLNDILYHKGYGRFLVATDVDGLMIQTLDKKKFEKMKPNLLFILSLSFIGLYIDGKRYQDESLVKSVEGYLEEFPEYLRDMIIHSEEKIRALPLMQNVSDFDKDQTEQVGMKLVKYWKRCLLSVSH